MKRSIAIKIAGQQLTIKSDAEESYVHSLAGLVDEKIREVQRGAKTAPTHAVAMLAALQIADDLLRERERRVALRRKVKDTASALRQFLKRELRS